MTSIRLLNYRAARDGHVLDDIISLWTAIFNPGTGPYSHSEIWYPSYMRGSAERSYEYGMCYSSTMRGSEHGTCLRPASAIIKHPERWDFIEIPVEESMLAYAIRRAEGSVENNEGYDKLMLLSFAWPVRFGSASKQICSEAAQQFMFWCCIFQNIHSWSPRRLSKRTLSLGHKLWPLAPTQAGVG